MDLLTLARQIEQLRALQKKYDRHKNAENKRHKVRFEALMDKTIAELFTEYGRPPERDNQLGIFP